MENPLAFSAPESLAGLLLRSAWAAIDENSAPGTLPQTLPELFTALDVINDRLAAEQQRLLLALDEFEMIDRKIGEGVFSADLLHTLRESIQTHRQITWAFVGSHQLSELTHDSWASYFVSLRTVELKPFALEETKLLLTEPLKYSPLWEKRRDEMPRFTSFWGKGGIDRIHTETGGWPHLVQLVAETAVDLANTKGAECLDGALLEGAFDESVRRGDTVLRQLIEGENCSSDEAEYLLAFRSQESQPEPINGPLRRALRRRLLVDNVDGMWRLRAPLMRRWIIANC